MSYFAWSLFQIILTLFGIFLLIKVMIKFIFRLWI